MILGEECGWGRALAQINRLFTTNGITDGHKKGSQGLNVFIHLGKRCLQYFDLNSQVGMYKAHKVYIHLNKCSQFFERNSGVGMYKAQSANIQFFL